MGILPCLAGWGAQLLKAGLRTGGLGSETRPFSDALITQLASADVWAAGAFALEQGQIITAMLLAALLVFAIEGRFLAAGSLQRIGLPPGLVRSAACLALLSADTVLDLGWGTGQPWAIAYGVMTLLILMAKLLPRASPSA